MVVVQTGQQTAAALAGELHNGVVAHVHGNHRVIADNRGAVNLVLNALVRHEAAIGIGLEGLGVDLGHEVPHLHVDAPPVLVLGGENVGDLSELLGSVALAGLGEYLMDETDYFLIGRNSQCFAPFCVGPPPERQGAIEWIQAFLLWILGIIRQTIMPATTQPIWTHATLCMELTRSAAMRTESPVAIAAE